MTINKYMALAIDEAKKTKFDIPVGAIIVQNDKIISIRHNEKELKQDVTAHAEILAIKEAEEKLHNWRLSDCEMYVTLEPCPMCATAIINSRISKVYFGAYDLLYGALGGKFDLRTVFKSKLKVHGGICEEECSKLLKDFWKNER